MFKQKQKQNVKFSAAAGRNMSEKIGRSNRTWRMLEKFSALAVIVLGISFIISVNSLSVKGFILQELKNKTRQLESEASNIELNIISMQSYENINRRAQNLKMVKTDKVEYVLAGTAGVAKK